LSLWGIDDGTYLIDSIESTQRLFTVLLPTHPPSPDRLTTHRNIFYWFVEASTDPDEAPLVFWTNGGPGCSGLYGFMNENGPFRPTKGGKALDANPYSWNRAANMLFVEQPGAWHGVAGFDWWWLD
jgi:hypothetical protein